MSRPADRPMVTAVEEARRKLRRRRWMIVLALLVVAIAGYLWLRRDADRPEDYADVGMGFEHGSAGGDTPVRGTPLA